MEDIKIDAYKGFQATNNFIYKNKSYPFNIIFFNCFSQYFTSQQLQIQPNSNIKLLDETEEDETLSDESINDFINHCQNQRIYLTKNNVPALHKLAIKYKVQSLIESTEDFIKTHDKEFVLDYLIMNQDNLNFRSEEYEDIIVNNFQDYINNDRLLNLHIQILHRILKGYFNKNLNSIEQSKIIEFLFKCLDKFERKASPLFEHVDFGNANGDVMQRLFNGYSEKFDFHFINSNQLITVYEKVSSMIEKEARIQSQLERMEQRMQQMTRQQEDRNREKDEQIQRKNDEISGEIGRMRQLIEQVQADSREEVNRVRQVYDEQIRQLRNDFTNQLNRLQGQIAQLNRQIYDLRNYPVICRFSSKSNTSGVISLLKNAVTLTAGGSIGPNHPLENIKSYNNNSFFNYYYTEPHSNSDSYIKFDLGLSKKIDLHSYFIRTNICDESWWHPKTWQIQGSNDDIYWTTLDIRDNDDNLRGRYKQHHFECQYQREHGGENNRYRYIKYIQVDSWYDRYPYNINLTYFELYGDVYG